MNKKPGRRRKILPNEVHELRKRIDHWRSTREKRSRMPEDLWIASAAAAQAHGAWSVSRALGVKYEGLKKRMNPVTAVANTSAPAFVEVDTTQIFNSGKGDSIVLELTSAGGSKLTMRIEGNDGLNVPALATAFWESNR